MKRDKRSLLERREKISQAISLLQSEYNQLSLEIREIEFSSNTKLNPEFFQNSVAPLLIECKNEGITSKDLQKKLNKLGFTFDPSGFRTFLTRTKDRGLLEMMPRTKGAALWLLSEEGLRLAESVLCKDA